MIRRGKQDGKIWQTALRRALGRITAMLLTAAMFIGTGLFAALGEVAEKAGSGLLLAKVSGNRWVQFSEGSSRLAFPAEGF
jgi:hypothetical protein